MWQRFTERARQVMFYAQEEAQALHAEYVSPEHLLLGLVRSNDGVALRVLEKLGLSADQIREEVIQQLPRGTPIKANDMALTPRAKRVIDLSYDEARNLSNNYIGTEHILLGLIREGDGLAGRVLARLGVKLVNARKEVIALQDYETMSQPTTRKCELGSSTHRLVGPTKLTIEVQEGEICYVQTRSELNQPEEVDPARMVDAIKRHRLRTSEDPAGVTASTEEGTKDE
jgi:ATP-dependent Clp protease ATP-binding subunit ClpC